MHYFVFYNFPEMDGPGEEKIADSEPSTSSDVKGKDWNNYIDLESGGTK